MRQSTRDDVRRWVWGGDGWDRFPRTAAGTFVIFGPLGVVFSLLGIAVAGSGDVAATIVCLVPAAIMLTAAALAGLRWLRVDRHRTD